MILTFYLLSVLVTSILFIWDHSFPKNIDIFEELNRLDSKIKNMDNTKLKNFLINIINNSFESPLYASVTRLFIAILMIATPIFNLIVCHMLIDEIMTYYKENIK